MNNKNKTDLIHLHKTMVLLFSFILSIVVTIDRNSIVTHAQTNETVVATQTALADKKTDPYYKYKYAYQHKNSSALSGSELTFYKNLKKCLDSAKKYKKLYQKEKAVYDWIVLHCRYDYDNYLAGTIPAISYSPEGVFIKGVAVCNGYAESFQLCMDILGIKCKTITGSDLFGNGHAWNAVKLDDGKWYQVDATWGDPVPDQAGNVDYQYFNLTDKVMKQSHIYKSSVSCKATKYSYWNAFEKDVHHITSTDEFYQYTIDAIKKNTSSCKLAIDYSVKESSLYDFYSVYRDTKCLADYQLKPTDTSYKNGCLYYTLTLNYTEVAGIISNSAEYADAIKTAESNAWTYYKVYVSDPNFVVDNYSADIVRSYSTTITSASVDYDRVQNSDLYVLSIAVTYMGKDVLADEDAVIEQVGTYLKNHTSGQYQSYTLSMKKPSGLQGSNIGRIQSDLTKKVETTYGVTDFTIFVHTQTNETLEIVVNLY